MRHTLQIDQLRLPFLAVVITTVVAVMMAAPAFAENPLYCSETTGNGGGCAGPHGLMHINEARNEAGGCIDVQFWVSGYGYGGVGEACSGNVGEQKLTIRAESFNKCWNASNGNDLIHCRYAVWGV
jgi:hypothetical protein